MTTKSEAARLADALARHADIDYDGVFAQAAALLRQWTDAAAQEPVAWQRLENDPDSPPHWHWVECSKWEYDNCTAKDRRRELFAAPPAAQPAGMVLVPREPTIAMCIAGDGARHNVDDATRAPAVYRAMIAASPAAPVVREPVIDEMDAVASKYAHKMALDLECVLSDYSGKWWDAAMQTLGEYRSAMNAIHERESPTHMGEPVLPQHGITGGGNG